MSSTDDLKKLVSQHAKGIVEEVRDDNVVFVSTVHNTKREKVYQEGGVDYATIRNLMLHSVGKGVVMAKE